MMYNLNEKIFNYEELNIIPLHWGPTKFYTMTFEGWGKITFDIKDNNMNEALSMASKTFRAFIDLYRETHAFTEPQLSWKPDGTFQIKIATLEIEEYEIRINNEKKND